MKMKDIDVGSMERTEYPAITYNIKTEDDGTVVRYNYRWYNTGETLSKEQVKAFEILMGYTKNED